jgi:glycosyltransferase involved in cell wall biosynthesis
MKTVYFFGNNHPINESYLSTPPQGFIFKSNLNESGFGIVGEYTRQHEFSKKFVNKVYNFYELPRIMYIPTTCDLIHTQGGIIPTNKIPHVITIEHSSSFFSLDDDRFDSQKSKSSLLKRLENKYCKKILPYSEATKKSLINALGEESTRILDKVEVVYPALDLKSIDPYVSKRNNEKDISLLFISRHFIDDGARELIKALEILDKKYDVKLRIVTNPPQHHREEFCRIVKRIKSKSIQIVDGVLPRSNLFMDYFSQSDIFVLPSYIHFFGFIMLEAMAFGMPLIGSNTYAIPEIVRNGINGYNVDSEISCFNEKYMKPKDHVRNYRQAVMDEKLLAPVTDQLVEEIGRIIENDSLRKKMGLESRQMVENGIFSTKERNHKISTIYRAALE